MAQTNAVVGELSDLSIVENVTERDDEIAVLYNTESVKPSAQKAMLDRGYAVYGTFAAADGVEITYRKLADF